MLGATRESESDVLRKVRQLLVQCGCVVVNTSQMRASNVHVGLPDKYALSPKRGGFWIEGKAADGRQSAAQREFQEQCIRCGVPYVLGGVEEVAHFLATGEIRLWTPQKPPPTSGRRSARPPSPCAAAPGSR